MPRNNNLDDRTFKLVFLGGFFIANMGINLMSGAIDALAKSPSSPDLHRAYDRAVIGLLGGITFMLAGLGMHFNIRGLPLRSAFMMLAYWSKSKLSEALGDDPSSDYAKSLESLSQAVIVALAFNILITSFMQVRADAMVRRDAIAFRPDSTDATNAELALPAAPPSN